MVKVAIKHISTASISKMVAYRAIFTTVIKYPIVFRLAYLDLTFAYSNGKRGRWNGVLRNVVA